MLLLLLLWLLLFRLVCLCIATSYDKTCDTTRQREQATTHTRTGERVWSYMHTWLRHEHNSCYEIFVKFIQSTSKWHVSKLKEVCVCVCVWLGVSVCVFAFQALKAESIKWSLYKKFASAPSWVILVSWKSWFWFTFSFSFSFWLWHGLSPLAWVEAYNEALFAAQSLARMENNNSISCSIGFNKKTSHRQNGEENGEIVCSTRY